MDAKGNSGINSRKRYYWTFTLFFLLFGSLVAVITSLINYNIQYTNVEKEIDAKFEAEKSFKYELLHEFLQHAENVVGAISVSELTVKYVSSGDSGDRGNLNQLLLAAVASNISFVQLRYIDAFGMESVRIDRDKKLDHPIVASPEKLQDKRGRYYFKDAALLPPGQFWYSNFDLNVEHGQIELPIRPTFRIATPVFVEGRFAGLIIANISIDTLLSMLGSSTSFDVYIVDKEGEFILHPEPRQAWSRYLPDRANLLAQFPEFGRSVLVVPDANAVSHFSFSLGGMLHNEDGAIVLAIPRQALLRQFKKDNLLTAGLTALIVLIVSFLLSGLVAVIPARLQSRLSDAYFAIKRSADIINRHVITSSTDKEGYILSVSSALTETYGFSLEEIVGKKHNIVRHPDTPEALYEGIWQTILQGKTWRGEILNRNKGGGSFWLNHVITPDFDSKGSIVGFTSVSHDITDKKNIERLSNTDTLTGLNNRRWLDDVFSAEFERFKRYGNPFAMILLDVDHFKQVNDNFGHKVGDSVLVEIAGVVAANIRKSDFIGRWGGEEFLIISPETSIDGAGELAEKIRKKIEVYDFLGAGKITASFGVTAALQDDTAEDVFVRSDKALYRAKGEGRNRVVTLHQD